MIGVPKKYQTRDGREAIVFMTDGGGYFPVIAAYRDRDGIWWPQHYRADGRLNVDREDPRDLIEVKERIRREIWANVYRGVSGNNDGNIHFHFNKEEADREVLNSRPKRIACVKLTIDCAEGEGT